jgi:two-component system, NarL family, invasion response regulator UvrY
MNLDFFEFLFFLEGIVLNGYENIFAQLSERELQVLLMIAGGGKANHIADQLCLSPKTINSYRYRLFEKLGVDSDVGLAHLAVRHSLLNVQEL